MRMLRPWLTWNTICAKCHLNFPSFGGSSGVVCEGSFSLTVIFTSSSAVPNVLLTRSRMKYVPGMVVVKVYSASLHTVSPSMLHS